MPDWKNQWKRFAAQKPGRRFRDRYDQRRSSRGWRAWWWRALNVMGGVLSFAIAIVLTVAPGPAVVFFALSGVLLANESRLAARSLDWIDARTSPWVHRINRHWNRLSPRMRRLAMVGMIGGSVTSLIVGILFIR